MQARLLRSVGEIQKHLPWLFPELSLFFLPQGPPGLKGERGDTVVIDYDGRILDALKVAFLVGPGYTLVLSGGNNHLVCVSVPHFFTEATGISLAQTPQLHHVPDEGTVLGRHPHGAESRCECGPCGPELPRGQGRKGSSLVKGRKQSISWGPVPARPPGAFSREHRLES